MRQHPESEELRSRLRQCLPLVQPWKGTFYRATTIDYANRNDLLAGIGSRLSGGRWTPPCLFTAVYGSLEPETAMAESLANYREFGIPAFEAMPLVFAAVNVKLQAVLDLSDVAVRKEMQISFRTLAAINWMEWQDRGDEALTQAIGRVSWEEKLEAILVPSVRRKDAINIVLFPNRRRRGSSWKIHRARKLPKKND